MNAGNFYRREFQPLLKRAGLTDEGFTSHSLRHTFATTLAAKGVHPSTAQKMLGKVCHESNGTNRASSATAPEPVNPEKVPQPTS